jgi:hypothetical protein
MPPPERVDASASVSSPLPPADAASRRGLDERDGERGGEGSVEPTKTRANRTKRAHGAYSKGPGARVSVHPNTATCP